MKTTDILAKWLRSADSLGGTFDEETEALRVEWTEAQAELDLAVLAASRHQVAEDEHGFLEAIEPVKAALARVKSNLADWESFIAKLEPRV